MNPSHFPLAARVLALGTLLCASTALQAHVTLEYQAAPYWPVRQLCEQGRIDWVEVPQPGHKPGELKAPAALLEVLPAAGGSHGHNH